MRRFINEHLVKITKDTSGWHTLHDDPPDSRLGELSKAKYMEAGRQKLSAYLLNMPRLFTDGPPTNRPRSRYLS